MKFSRTGRFEEKNQGWSGGSDLQNVSGSISPLLKNSTRGCQVPHQSVSVESNEEFSPLGKGAQEGRTRESQDYREQRLDTAVLLSAHEEDDASPRMKD